MRGNGLLPREVLSVIFQFTPLHERQHICKHINFSRKYFNSCLYMRGNAENRAVAFHSTYFNSRLYTRGDLLYSVCIYSLANFNSHLYIRGDTNKLPIAAEEEIFQFTPLYERRPVMDANGNFRDIFQFTPLHERQHRWHRGCNLYIYFNSRLYMRGNLMLQNLQCYHLIISIHAST